MTTSSYFFNAVSYTKDTEQFTPEEIKKDYSPYVVNRMVAGYSDLVILADEMNISHNINKEYQMLFYAMMIPKKKRRVTFASKTKDENLKIVMEYYNITQEKADPYLKILTREQISTLKERLNKGGRS
jgi:hypothetical protein